MLVRLSGKVRGWCRMVGNRSFSRQWSFLVATRCNELSDGFLEIHIPYRKGPFKQRILQLLTAE